MCVGLVLLAHGAALNVFAHKLHKTGPPKLRGDELMSFEVTWVTSSFVVVAAGEDGATEGILWGNIDMALVGEDVVVEFPIEKVSNCISRINRYTLH